MQSFKKFISEADKYCSDKCCGSDVKAEDCKCPPDCSHCDCNADMKEEVGLDEAKTGMFGGKYTSKDHMIGMKNFTKIRDKRHKQRDAEHAKQDPKMAKMGYAKHMLDTDKADAKARKRGIDPTGKYDKYKKKNGIREELNLSEDEINDITAQYINENNITLDQLENMTEEELNELIGKALGGAFKIGAKAAVGATRLAGKAVKKAVYNKQGNVRGTQAAKNDAAKAQIEKLKQKRKELVQKRLQQRKSNQLKSSIEREKNKLAASKAKANK